MKIKRFEFNMFPVNCYVLWDETNEAVVIDPGCFYDEEKQALKNFIVTNNLNIKHLLEIHSCFASSGCLPKPIRPTSTG